MSEVESLTKFAGCRGVFIHDPWIHNFSTGDTDDWFAMFLERNLKLSHLTIYIPYSESRYGKTRYDEVIRLIPKGIFMNNEIIIDYKFDSIQTLIKNANVIGIMSPLTHPNDKVIIDSLNSVKIHQSVFTQGENGRYNRSASPLLKPLFDNKFLGIPLTIAYHSNDTRERHNKIPYTFHELSMIIPMPIIKNIMIPYKIYKLICPPSLTNPYLPKLYLLSEGAGNNIIGIQKLAFDKGYPNLTDPTVSSDVEKTVKMNNITLNMMANFELPSRLYTISGRDDLTPLMKEAFTSLIVVAQMFNLYNNVNIDKIYDLSEAMEIPEYLLPSLENETNPMWDANTIIAHFKK